jgi:pre-mRNA cleavage complex 2 protein Pcf11
LSFRGLLTNHCLICIQIPPPFKLTAFYLLDAISKNLYEPYARHFGPVVVPLFLDTYSQVDESTKAKMIEMLATWRAGAPNGKELFGAVPQLAIEQDLFGTSTPSVCTLSDRVPFLLMIPRIQDAARISPAQVLGELQFAIGQAEREMQSNPYNNTLRTQLPVLHQVSFFLSSPHVQASDVTFQLRQFVEKGLSQDELRQILSQLRNITRPPVQLPPQSYPAASNVSALPPTTYSQYSYNHAGPSSAPPQSYPPQPAYSQGTIDVKPTFPLAPVQPVSAAPPAPTNQASVPALPAVNDIANLYSALLKAGVVGVPGTPPVASSAVNEPKPESTDSSSKSISNHARKLLSQRIELSTTGIAR